jgi:uroporphyrinogen decarboxylase
MHHCCGSIRPFIRSFVDLGVQVLNPIQVSAANMDPAGLKAEFGRDLAFWGGVDTRSVMPRGTPAAVALEVQRRLREMGRGGGYILAAVHNLQPEVPPANIVALFEAGRRYGRYPLD